VKLSDFRSFVVADIPGLIEGAHKGAGLGFQFLRHVERTSILLHLIDISYMVEGDPADNFEKINRELGLYSPLLLDKQQAVVATKLDIADKKKLDRLRQYCKTKGIDFFALSAVTGQGIKKLLSYLAKKVEEERKRRKLQK
jgi:GTP-binding protein